MTKLLALAASHREHSLNRRLLEIAVRCAQAEGAQVHMLDYRECDAPLYRGEAMVDSLPPGVALFSHALRTHDGLLLAMPEYNWSLPGVLKNLIDWLSIDPHSPLNGKTALLMCASPSLRGGISGLQHARTPLEVLGMWVYPQVIGIGRADEQLLPDRLAREADQQHLTLCVSDFIRATTVLVNRG